MGMVQWRRADKAMRSGGRMNSSTTIMVLGSVLVLFALSIALLLGLR